jgi:hypothetical protein
LPGITFPGAGGKAPGLFALPQPVLQFPVLGGQLQEGDQVLTSFRESPQAHPQAGARAAQVGALGVAVQQRIKGRQGALPGGGGRSVSGEQEPIPRANAVILRAEGQVTLQYTQQAFPITLRLGSVGLAQKDRRVTPHLVAVQQGQTDPEQHSDGQQADQGFPVYLPAHG